jgi:hypothetical protein
MTSVRVVTTFSRDGYKLYGKKLLESFTKWCPNVPISAYHESLSEIDFVADNLYWRNLDHNDDRAKWIKKHGGDPEKVSDARFPNRQSIRFCHKVFALANEVANPIAQTDWLVWCDADVLFYDTPLWSEVLPDSAELSYLGRSHMYTECGFVGYRVSKPSVVALVEDMKRYYTSDEIFTRDIDDRHDSRCFDICCERSDVPRDRWHNLSRGIIGTHVWPQTKLAAFCTHQKGPRRKGLTYGGVVS